MDIGLFFIAIGLGSLLTGFIQEKNPDMNISFFGYIMSLMIFVMTIFDVFDYLTKYNEELFGIASAVTFVVGVISIIYKCVWMVKVKVNKKQIEYQSYLALFYSAGVYLVFTGLKTTWLV